MRTVVTPCQLLDVSSGSQRDLHVEVRMHVDETRRHHLPRGVDLGGTHLASEVADRRDSVAVDGNIGVIHVPAGPVDDHPVADDELVRHRTDPFDPPANRRRGL